MKVYNSSDIRKIEAFAESAGFSTYRMMENAGLSSAEVITGKFNIEGKRVLLLAGPGNNGGDGFVTAKKLFDDGAIVSVILTDGTPKTENAKKALSLISNYNISFLTIDDTEAFKHINNADIIIDAIFGIGFHGTIDGKLASIIRAVNSAKAARISLDIPSGAECDSARVAGACFAADITITFIAVKPCHILYPASDYCGSLVRVGIGIPQSKMPEIISNINLIDDEAVKNSIPKLLKNEHKGSRGTVLNICGSYTMAGAAILSAKAAIKSGVGKVICVIPKSIYTVCAAAVPEAVFMPKCEADGYISEAEQESIIMATKNADAVLIGCGCGTSDNFKSLLSKVLLNVNKPLIIDADGINAISGNIDILAKSEADIVITPHPKEMARLLGTTVKDIMENRLKAATLLAQKLKLTVVLKGANTLIATKNGEIYVCMHGNPGMATAGSGDVLSGVITALSCGIDTELAAVCGVNIHAISGDFAAENLSMHSMSASDITDSLHLVFRQFESR